MSARVHATAVALGDRGVLIVGASGAGKSDLALRLIDRGARLIADDYVEIRVADGRAYGSPPPSIAGRLEVRGIGIAILPYVRDVALALVVDLDTAPARLPERTVRQVEGIEIAGIAINAHDASAPVKVELALSGRLMPLDLTT